jgi:hypothetical protein
MTRLFDMDLLNRVLRAPDSVADDCRNDQGADAIARTSLIAIVLGSVLYGAAVGSWRGGVQTLFAAGKLPVVMLATLIISLPAFYAIAAIFGRTWPLRSLLSLMLAAGARFALVLLATTPPLWLLINLGASYDASKLAAAIAYGLAGLAALALLVRGVGAGSGRRAMLTLVGFVFLLVGAQTSWMLRPYLGTPGEREVVLFTREREGGLVYQVFDSIQHLGQRRPGERP